MSPDRAINFSIVLLCIVYAADAVFESVAQVLLSRSRGLTSRFQQLVSKSDAEVMKCCEYPLSFSLSLSLSTPPPPPSQKKN